MKKTIVKYLNKPALLTTVSIVISLILLLLLVPAMLFPRFNSWFTLRSTNQEDLKRLEIVVENVSLLVLVDETRQESYKELVEKLVPNEKDEVRVVSIMHELIRKAGVKLQNITIGSGSGKKVVTAAPSPAAGVAQAESGEPPPAPAPTGPTATAPVTGIPTSLQAGTYKASATFEGSFSAILKLIRLLDNTKRSIGVTKIIMSRDEETKKAVATVNFSLPLSKVSTASSSERIELTDAEIKKLEELLVLLTIDAKPTSLPTGRSNPFN